MHDMPNTVGEAAQSWHDNHVRDRARNKLHSAMGYPRWDLLPVSDSNVKPSRINWLIWPALVIGVGVVIGIASI